jgi:hypothetical protein
LRSLIASETGFLFGILGREAKATENPVSLVCGKGAISLTVWRKLSAFWLQKPGFFFEISVL